MTFFRFRPPSCFFLYHFLEKRRKVRFFSTNGAVGFVVWGNWPKQCDRLELFPAIILVTGFLRKRYFLCAKMGKNAGKTRFFAGNRGETCRSLHFCLITSRGRTPHATRVQSVYLGCKLDTPWMYTRHSMG